MRLSFSSSCCISNFNTASGIITFEQKKENSILKNVSTVYFRLFSEGAEGDERPGVAGKPAAPLHPFHPNMKIRRGVLEAECADIMQQFFQLRRRKEKKLEESGHKPGLLHKVLKFPVIRKKRSS